MNRQDDTDATLDRSRLEAARSESQGLSLVVIGEGFVESHVLPQKGALTIGRAETNAVSIDHALISREHARVEVGHQIELVDLGSRNGTFIRGDRLEPNERRAIEPGQLFAVGETSCLIQRGPALAPSSRLVTHAVFEDRLEASCRVGSQTRAPFVVGRLHVDDDVAPRTAQRALAGARIIASYAPGEYEFILDEADDAALSTHVRTTLQGRGRLGLARFPEHGRSPDQLIERACASVLPPAPAGDEPGFVVLDEAMKDLYRIAERVAQGSISVLLLGETGVGKEVFAEALHRASPRREHPFVRINCAALSETLLESELFGHEKGAFTGATDAKVGLLESAQGGTVLLDELGEMPLPTQAKLLRVLEQREVMRVGGTKPVAIDVRWLAATNRDLEAEVLAGTFRQDVFFRLNGATLSLPPLRERPKEVEALAQRFAEQTATELGLPQPPELTPSAVELLLGYAWPGNIRELKNVIARAVLLTTSDQIDVEHLPSDKMKLPWTEADDGKQTTGLSAAEDDERARILDALEKCAGNQTRAAKLLGIGRRTLTTKLTKYGIRRPRKR